MGKRMNLAQLQCMGGTLPLPAEQLVFPVLLWPEAKEKSLSWKFASVELGLMVCRIRTFHSIRT